MTPADVQQLEELSAARLRDEAERTLAAAWLAGLKAACEHFGGVVFPLLVRAAADACHPWCQSFGYQIRRGDQEQRRTDDRVSELAARVDELKVIVDELTMPVQPPDWA